MKERNEWNWGRKSKQKSREKEWWAERNFVSLILFRFLFLIRTSPANPYEKWNEVVEEGAEIQSLWVQCSNGGLSENGGGGWLSRINCNTLSPLSLSSVSGVKGKGRDNRKEKSQTVRFQVLQFQENKRAEEREEAEEAVRTHECISFSHPLLSDRFSEKQKQHELFGQVVLRRSRNPRGVGIGPLVRQQLNPKMALISYEFKSFSLPFFLPHIMENTLLSWWT